jgi:hypothetical protein
MSVKIYAVRNHSSSDTYIGSTTQTLCDRLAEHRADMKRGRAISSIQVMKCPTAYIELLEECEKSKKKERERWWIRNTPNCINEQKLQTDEEKRVAMNKATVEYHKRNRELHNQRAREWRAKNKESVRETNRKQYEKRKLKVSV